MDHRRGLSGAIGKHGMLSNSDPARLGRALFHGLPVGGFGLLRDLQDILTLVHRARNDWTVLVHGSDRSASGFARFNSQENNTCSFAVTRRKPECRHLHYHVLFRARPNLFKKLSSASPVAFRHGREQYNSVPSPLRE
jgi:hypothetical protein